MSTTDNSQSHEDQQETHTTGCVNGESTTGVYTLPAAAAVTLSNHHTSSMYSSLAAAPQPVSTFALPYTKTAAYILAKHRAAQPLPILTVASSPPLTATSTGQPTLPNPSPSSLPTKIQFEYSHDETTTTYSTAPIPAPSPQPQLRPQTRIPIEEQFAETDRLIKQIEQDEANRTEARRQQQQQEHEQQYQQHEAEQREQDQEAPQSTTIPPTAEQQQPQEPSFSSSFYQAPIHQHPSQIRTPHPYPPTNLDGTLTTELLPSPFAQPSSNTFAFTPAAASGSDPSASPVSSLQVHAFLPQHSPWMLRPASSPLHGTGINGEFFRSRLQPDRLAIGSPESIIADTTRYQTAAKLEEQRQQSQLADRPTIKSSPPPSKSPMFAEPESTGPSLRDQLRQLHASPTRPPPERSTVNLSSMDEPNSSLAFSQFRTTPDHHSLYPTSYHPSPSPTDAPHRESALQHQLNDFNANMHGFQYALLAQKQKLESERAEALMNMEASVKILQESLELETTNCDTSIQSLKKYTESVIESWNLTNADPWSAQLADLEQVAMAMVDRVQLLDAQFASDNAERSADFSDMDQRITQLITDIRNGYHEHVSDKDDASHQQALIRLDGIEKKMQHLAKRLTITTQELTKELDQQIQHLLEGRNETNSSVEQLIVQEVTVLRDSLYTTTSSRVHCDDELRKAFRFATAKLQKGLYLLRK